MSEIRLNKAMAMLGICSRRTADEFISKGMVKVNNIKVNELGTKVKQGNTITVNSIDYTLKNKSTPSVWIYNKPVGLIVSHKDTKGRDTVFDVVKDLIGERVISVGRLDINSEGLLLLTNSGEFAHYAENPKTGWERHYKVRAFGTVQKDFIQKLKEGITIDGIRYAPIKVSILDSSDKSKNHWFLCILKEGKNREVRKVFEHFGLRVNRLIRTKYGRYELGNLPVGKVIKAQNFIKNV